ncbi:hypothetical protein ACJX0J_031371, partial [Zea mays]
TEAVILSVKINHINLYNIFRDKGSPTIFFSQGGVLGKGLQKYIGLFFLEYTQGFGVDFHVIVGFLTGLGSEIAHTLFLTLWNQPVPRVIAPNHVHPWDIDSVEKIVQVFHLWAMRFLFWDERDFL